MAQVSTIYILMGNMPSILTTYSEILTLIKTMTVQ